MPQPDFRMSSDSRFAMQALRAAAVGEVVLYAKIEEATSRPLHEIRSAIATARRALLREENMVFSAVASTGLKRLSDAEIVGTSSKVARRIKGAARRGVKTLTAVADFSGLTREDQMRHSASVSVFSAVAQMTTERSLLKIEKAVDPTLKELPFKSTLDAFRGVK